MNGIRPVAVVILLSALLFAPSTQSAEVTRPDRESTYPDGVVNITHEPWAPKAGDDVRVTVTLGPDAPVPNRMSLLYCRVEPNYVCTARPPQMEPRSDGRIWTASIPWDDRFMEPDTRHVGYNVTMRFADPSTETGARRVAAPTGNHWLPETYPDDADGTYYFFAYSGSSRDSPAPHLGILLVFVALAALASRGGPRGGTRV